MAHAMLSGRKRSSGGTIVRGARKPQSPQQMNAKKGKRTGTAVALESALAGGHHCFSTVSQGVKSALLKGSNALGALEATCRDVGVMANVVSLTLGGVLREDDVQQFLLGRCTPQVGRAPPSLKTLVNQTWTACADAILGKVRDRQNQEDHILWDAAKRVLEPHLATLRTQVTRRVRAMVVDSIVAELGTELGEMLKLMPLRLMQVLRTRLKMAAPVGVDDDFIRSAARVALDLALAASDEADAEQDKLSKLAKTNSETIVVLEAIKLARTERVELGALVADLTADRKRGAFIDQFNNTTLILLLPHLHRYSLWAEDCADAAYGRKSVHTMQVPGRPDVSIFPCAVTRVGAVPAAAGSARLMSVPRARATTRLAPPFGVLASSNPPRAAAVRDYASHPVVEWPARRLSSADSVRCGSREQAAVRLAPVRTAALPPLERLVRDSRVGSAFAASAPYGQCRRSLMTSLVPPCRLTRRLAVPLSAPGPRCMGVASAGGWRAQPLVGAPADKRADVRSWDASLRPKPFGLAPVRALRHASLRFTATTEAEMWRAWLKGDLKDKYGCAVAPPTELDRRRAEAFIERKEPGAFFERRKLARSRRAPVWQLASYRTDSVQLGVTFVSGLRDMRLDNWEHIAQYGADKRKPIRGADPHKHYGHIRVSETHVDGGLPAEERAPPVCLVSVDPGAICPAACAVCASDKAPAEAEFFQITAANHRRRSGREHAEKQETKRRQGTPYGAAMARLRASAGRRRSASAAYLVYVADCFETLPVRVPRARVHRPLGDALDAPPQRTVGE